MRRQPLLLLAHFTSSRVRAEVERAKRVLGHGRGPESGTKLPLPQPSLRKPSSEDRRRPC
jgi:hypothetical protein